MFQEKSKNSREKFCLQKSSHDKDPELSCAIKIKKYPIINKPQQATIYSHSCGPPIKNVSFAKKKD